MQGDWHQIVFSIQGENSGVLNKQGGRCWYKASEEQFCEVIQIDHE